MNKLWWERIQSGFFIALIAMPLSLGIAIASSCPPIAGILTAIVGGMIASLLGGSKLSIKGPAAGLIVIIMAAVNELGQGDLASGYKKMLAVAVVAALLQIAFALGKLARFGRLMPPSVIHGMLAAIGIIIIAKQIHILVGAVPHGKSTFSLITEIPESIANINPELAFIGIFTVFCLIILPLVPNRHLKILPPALLALLVVVPLGLYWHLDVAHTYRLLNHEYLVGPNFLVDLPSSLLGSIAAPDFSVLTELSAYKFVLMLALVGSIESVLTVIAVDSLSKTSKKSNLNRDLLAVGLGNLLCAFIGGLPMISEVVRSKANIDNGAKDHWPSFFHGFFLLAAVLWLSPLIKEIPLSALAAMLIVTGFRLSAPSVFIKTYLIGLDQILLFTATLVVTLASDLLLGICAGILLKICLHIFRGVKISSLFKLDCEINLNKDNAILRVKSPAIFCNYFSLQKKINKTLKNANSLVIDFSQAKLVDHTVLSCLNSLNQELMNKSIGIVGLDKLNKSTKHPLSTHRFAQG